MRKPRKPKWLKNAEREQAAAEGEARIQQIVEAWAGRRLALEVECPRCSTRRRIVVKLHGQDIWIDTPHMWCTGLGCLSRDMEPVDPNWRDRP